MTLRIKGATTIKGTTTVGFSPATLFMGGIQGVWYDPSDFSTMFQDSAGANAVTAAEQTVGCILDKRNANASTYFDGSGDYLTLANNAAFNFGSGAFTVECWVRFASVATSQSVVSNYGNATTGWSIYLDATKIKALLSGDGPDIVGTTTISTNTWYHVAVSGSAGSIKLFVNGAQEGATFTGAVSLDTSAQLTIGGLLAGSVIDTVNGYISNLRIVKGVALYTANFTPPTSPLTPVTGTSLLTCGVGWSGNPTITVNGNTTLSALNPFGPATGNHATQSTSGNRPVLSARVNLLTKTEDFTNAAWSALSGATVNSAKSFTFSATDSRVYQFVTTVAGVNYVLSAAFDAADVGKKIRLAYFASGTWFPGSDITIPSSGRVSVTFSGSVTYIGLYAPSVDFSNTYTLATGVDLRPTNQGVGLPAYQRVNTSTDYDTTGFPFYLAFDGANTTATGKFMSTGNIDFSSGNVVTAFSGFKVNTATANLIYENGQGVNSTTGFGLFVNLINSANDLFIMRGTSQFERNANVSSTTLTQVTSATYDIANSPYITAKSNGATLSLATNFGSNPGSGNFSTQPLYIGRRQSDQGGKLNGNIYGLIIRGAASTSDQITATENWMNTKTRAY